MDAEECCRMKEVRHQKPQVWIESYNFDILPGLFLFFSFFSHHKYRTNLTINYIIVDGVLGTRTRGGRMVGADESNNLWRHRWHIFNCVEKDRERICFYFFKSSTVNVADCDPKKRNLSPQSPMNISFKSVTVGFHNIDLLKYQRHFIPSDVFSVTFPQFAINKLTKLWPDGARL